METNAKICGIDFESLGVVKYPDPRLREVCSLIDEVDDDVRRLVDRMFEVMFESQGLGLAAPQVGITVRIFIASPTFDPSDRKVYINPEIVSTGEKNVESEEGCLSLPGVIAKVKRADHVHIRALDYNGESFEEDVDEPLGQAFRQHEMDHLNGVTLVDRMGSIGRLSNRRALKDLEREFAEKK